MKYKIEQTVTIVSFKWIKTHCYTKNTTSKLLYYSNLETPFSLDMIKYCNKKYIIKKCIDNTYNSYYYLQNISDWQFADWMFKESYIPYKKIIKRIIDEKL